MKTDELIRELARDLVSVRPLRRPHFVALIWCLLGIAVAALVVWPLRSSIPQPGSVHIIPIISGLALAVSSAYGALRDRIPGNSRHTARWPVFGFAAVLLALEAVFLFRGPPLSVAWARLDVAEGVDCSKRVLTASVIVGIPLIWLTLRGYLLRPARSGFVAALAAGALSATALRIFCPLHTPLHTLMFHFLPIVILLLLFPVATAWLQARRFPRSQ